MEKIYYVDITDDSMGMDAISLVEYPAVEVQFLTFSKQDELKFSYDEDKHIITGVVCLADTPIHQYSHGVGDWYCVFTRDVIRKIVAKYSKDNLWNSVNIEHDDNLFVDGVYMIESYLKDSERGIVPVEFKEIPDGSWLCSFYVQSDELWNEIKNGGHLHGFSLQGYFELFQEATIDKELDDLMNRILGN